MPDLLLKRAAASPGEVYDVLCGRRIVGRVMLSKESTASRWVWMLSYGHHEDRTPTPDIAKALGTAAVNGKRPSGGRPLRILIRPPCGQKLPPARPGNPLQTAVWRKLYPPNHVDITSNFSILASNPRLGARNSLAAASDLREKYLPWNRNRGPTKARI